MMDAFFTPIFIIMMVCLLLECFSLLLGDVHMAITSRLIICMLLYLAYILKRDLIERALKQKSRKLIKFYVYVLFICATVSLLFHCLLFYALSHYRLYTLTVILLSSPVALDEYHDLLWLKERRRFYKLQSKSQSIEEEEESITMRPSLYYVIFKRMCMYRDDNYCDNNTGIV